MEDQSPIRLWLMNLEAIKFYYEKFSLLYFVKVIFSGIISISEVKYVRGTCLKEVLYETSE